MERWHGRVALVTGASEGIGAAIAARLATLGMRVVGVARSHHKIEEWAAQLGESAGEVHALRCDVSSEEDVVAAVAWAREHLGGVHVLVNNAGVAPMVNLHGEEFINVEEKGVQLKFLDGGTEAIRRTLNVNVFGLCLFTREVIKDMRQHGVDDGHIFHINSDSGQSILEEPGYYVYGGTKHAVRVLTEGLRRELRDLKTKIRSISPGLVRTNILNNNGIGKPLSDMYFEGHPSLQPEDVAAALEFALATPPHVQVIEIHELTLRSTGDLY